MATWLLIQSHGLKQEQETLQFFKQYLLLLLVYQMASGLFRFLGAVGRTMVISLILWSSTLLLLAVLSGYVLSRVNMKKYWIWAYWISPMIYAQNGFAVNEFLGKSWCHVLPNATEPLGVTILKSQELFPEAYWYWMSVGALIGFTIFFNILYTLALTFLHATVTFHAVVPEGSEKDKQVAGVGAIEQNMKQRGKALPFARHIITFSDIRYSIDMPKTMGAKVGKYSRLICDLNLQAMRKQVADEKLELLKGVSGAFRPGVLTALMGVSGAGKTTLPDASKEILGFLVTQKGKKLWLEFLDTMFIEEIMELVELTLLRGAFVGLPGVSGLSTEQRKRLTIAVGLVANPSIIFMDEPTSGLDARAAAIVMSTVRNTVDTGRTVVCTIHQPSIDIFGSFNGVRIFNKYDTSSMTMQPLFLNVKQLHYLDILVPFRSSLFWRVSTMVLQLLLMKRGGKRYMWDHLDATLAT
ncbi:Pleiotropic drug resistance protein 1-like protein [Drosera capensis]